ncbi:MAG: SAM-dependent methyltransferase [Acidobacteria bacterium]|nr:MAG: SAM-dependent methyltransferase [Acidobacteriota bacterium]
MRFYNEHIYPWLVSSLGDPKPIQEVRQRIVPLAQGTVLEVGVGPGVNFAHYNPTTVSKVYALEPNRGMVRLAEQHRHQTNLNIEFLDRPGERIPLENASVDTAVSTFTLCTIPGVMDAIRGIRRVLRSSGKFIFFEHGLAPEPSTQRWQRWSEPIPHCLFAGCHVTRHIPSLISEGGFQIEQIESGYLVPFPKSWTYCFWGTARPQSQ